jgi:single-strand DNA-binding protein
VSRYGDPVNVVSLIGDLASDVEVKQVGQGRRVASFLLAVDRPSTEGGADFVHVSAWDRQAELCERHLARGTRVAVDGRLRSRSWQGPDGGRRSAVEVVANRLQFLSWPLGAEVA